MTKMFTFLIAAAIIFFSATCYAATKPVYDLNEQIFVEDFNAMAKAMSIDVIDTKIKNLPSGAHELSGKNFKLNLTLNQSGSIENILLTSTDKKRLADGFIVTLATIGLSADEFNKFFADSKKNILSVWCNFSKRQIIAERSVEGNTIKIFIKAETKQ